MHLVSAAVLSASTQSQWQYKLFFVNRAWTLNEASLDLPTVVERAGTDGVQVLLRDGKPAAVVISMTEFESLKNQKLPMGDFLQNLPWHGMDIDFDRDRSPAREVGL